MNMADIDKIAEHEKQLTELVDFIFKSGWCCYFNKEVESKGRIKQRIFLLKQTLPPLSDKRS